jgi:release factor glutamine methyltransferase
MQLHTWLADATKVLEASSVPTARLDCLILIEDVVGKDRAWLLAHPEEELTSTQVSKLTSFVARRAKHVPLAYIRGKSEFYGREFLVTPATLQPRPETETMITLLKKLLQHNSFISRTRSWKQEKRVVMVDVGTGSGCIGITAKLEFPDAEVLATEINADALRVAQKNAKQLGAEVKFFHGNLLEPVLSLHPTPLAPFIVLANLPYVPDSHTINKAAMQEPSVAIFGGSDGLDLYREMLAQISKYQVLSTKYLRPRYILTESLPFQHAALLQIAREYGYTEIIEQDFIQVFKNLEP